MSIRLGKELKAKTGIAKSQYKVFKDQINVNNNNREKDKSDEDISNEDESNESKTLMKVKKLMQY